MHRKLPILSLVLFFCSVFVSCKMDSGVDNLSLIEKNALYDTASVFYGHFDRYPAELSQLSIGVIDCSADGFSVIEKLLSSDAFDNITGHRNADGIRDFAGENFQYLADLANGPYIGYVMQGNDAYLHELLVKDALFLMGDSHYNLSVDDFKSGIKPQVKAVVYADDYMELKGVDVLNRFLNQTGTGVVSVGVFRSAVEDLAKKLQGKESACIGILYPTGMLNSREYESAVREMAAAYGFDGTLQVYNQAAVGLSGALRGEEQFLSPQAMKPRNDYAGPVIGLSYNNIDISLLDRYNFNMSGNAMLKTISGVSYGVLQLNSFENYVRYHLVSIVERHRRSGSKIPLSSILLVDYRYGELLDVMENVMKELYDYKRDGIYLYHNVISRDFKFVVPLESTAVALYSMLREYDILALNSTKSGLKPFISMPSTGIPFEYTDTSGALLPGFKFHRNVGTENIYTKELPFAPRYIDKKKLESIEIRTPLTYSLIRSTLY